ncbi:MAG: hypothetical protein KF866_08765 [Phycisphaeraceae bacterium]|nr:hypothetical protein [Phycisphaeraceae bacterium]MCW5753969.1 hypothetical protein [Phycisphaeraceae bacterium]
MKQLTRHLVSLVAAAGTVTLVMAGCSTGATRISEEGVNYPSNLAQGETLDVQVIRRETVIEISNTSALDLPPGKLWLNAWFASDFPGLAVGQTRTFRLADFKDRHGERFAAGGFWATRPPDQVVLAQIETTDAQGAPKLLGLVVIGTTNPPR